MKIYQVAYIRDGRIESVVKLTKSLNAAQLTFVSEVEQIDKEEARRLIRDFAHKDLEDNVTLLANDELGVLSLQLFGWDIDV
jgi:uncharacterized protein HemY